MRKSRSGSGWALLAVLALAGVGILGTACGSAESDTKPRTEEPLRPTATSPVQNDFGSQPRDVGGGSRWNPTSNKGKGP
ncbi:MAG TPA: hypothetical protein VIF09_04005 [Polyangiaceae bacterium]|jgi:hypothetical protein